MISVWKWELITWLLFRISFEWLTCYKNPLAASVPRSHISVAARSTRVECDSQSVLGQNELNPLLGQGWPLGPVLKAKLTLQTDKIDFPSYLIFFFFKLSMQEIILCNFHLLSVSWIVRYALGYDYTRRVFFRIRDDSETLCNRIWLAVLIFIWSRSLFVEKREKLHLHIILYPKQKWCKYGTFFLCC